MIIDRLDKRTKIIAAEIEGWEQFADKEGWLNNLPDDYILYLPYPKVKVPGDTLGWELHAANFSKAIEGINFEGKKILDLAAGRTWTSKELTLRGGIVTATDILRRDGIGLETAYRYFKHHNIKYSLVLCDMNHLPFDDEEFDICFVHASLHHSENLQQAISEMRRVCKKGGMIILSAEPVGSFYSKIANKYLIGNKEFGINETTPRLYEYTRQLGKDVMIIPGEDGGWRSYIKNQFLKQIVLRICGGTCCMVAKNV